MVTLKTIMSIIMNIVTKNQNAVAVVGANTSNNNKISLVLEGVVVLIVVTVMMQTNPTKKWFHLKFPMLISLPSKI